MRVLRLPASVRGPTGEADSTTPSGDTLRSWARLLVQAPRQLLVASRQLARVGLEDALHAVVPDVHAPHEGLELLQPDHVEILHAWVLGSVSLGRVSGTRAPQQQGKKKKMSPSFFFGCLACTRCLAVRSLGSRSEAVGGERKRLGGWVGASQKAVAPCPLVPQGPRLHHHRSFRLFSSRNARKRAKLVYLFPPLYRNFLKSVFESTKRVLMHSS